MRVWSVLAVCVGMAFPWHAAEALQYGRVPLEPPSVLIQAVGPIVPGDLQRLAAFLRTMQTTDRVVGFAVDSPGGTLVEAAQIADLINKWGFSVLVPNGSKCVSACFLLFAAARHRYAADSALVGVHGASDAGKDDWNSMAVTTVVARALTQYGVPPAIIGKMVGTAPDRVEWLTPADLQSMGVIIFTDNRLQSPQSPNSAPLPSSTHLPMDMRKYCQANYGPPARAIALDPHDASSWRCTTALGLVGISLTKLCLQQYGPGYRYALGDRRDASSWSCVPPHE